MEIQELDKNLIHLANSNSFNGNRGNLSANSYKSYIDEVMSWNIPDIKKQKILDQVYKKYSEILKYEAQHISVIVAGPARYNSKKLDKSDQILQKTQDFCNWFDSTKKQIEKEIDLESNINKSKEVVKSIFRFIELGFNPTKELMELATIDNKKFIELYEKLQIKYKWRKNSNIYKIYQASLNGEIKEIKNEIFFEDENLTAYIRGDRAYIKFLMKCKRPLIVALKSRKWWWNSYEGAWSTYLNKLDTEWVSNISTKYEKYI